MFGISGTELFFIAVFALLIFGPDKLPQFGRTVGRFMREFKRAQDNMEAVIRSEMYEGKGSGTSVSGAQPKKAAPVVAPEDDDEEEEEEEE